MQRTRTEILQNVRQLAIRECTLASLQAQLIEQKASEDVIYIVVTEIDRINKIYDTLEQELHGKVGQ